MSSSAWTVSPVRVVVAAMVLTMTSWLVRGRPRQFIVMWENSRCSILFHLLVPGGRWQTVIVEPGLGGEGGEFGLPQPGAGAVGAAAVGGDQQPVARRVACRRRSCCHQRRMVLDGERGGVVVGADADPAGVGGDVVDAVRGWPCPAPGRRSRGP